MSQTSASYNIGGGLGTIPEYANNTAAIVGGLAQGKPYSLPYLLPGDIYPLAVVGPLIFENTSMQMAVVIDEAQQQQAITIQGSDVFNLKVDWGDGTIEIFTAEAAFNQRHHYAVPDSYIVTVTVSKNSLITGLIFNQNDSGSSSFVALLNNIDIYENLYTLNLADGKFDSNVGPLDYPALLGVLLIPGNNLEDFDSSTLPAALNFISMSNNKLSVDAINRILIKLDQGGFNGGTAYLNQQTPPASPDGAGVDAYDNLVAKGWTVSID